MLICVSKFPNMILYQLYISTQLGKQIVDVLILSYQHTSNTIFSFFKLIDLTYNYFKYGVKGASIFILFGCLLISIFYAGKVSMINKL